MYRPERWEYRLTLTDVERGLNADRTVVVGRHPSETTEHLALRVLAFCLVYEEGLSFGPGVCVGDAPDLMANDLTGHLSLWVGCGDVSADLAKKVVQHNRDAKAHIVFDGEERYAAFTEKVRHWPKLPRNWGNLTAWLPPPSVLAYLKEMETLRQRWIVTLAGGHLYLEADGVVLEGPVQSWVAPT
ncbi:MAG: YaeQ family protein [Myxococcales bacterium]|nr:YaeQ family protein [Myxococcales bacterium]